MSALWLSLGALSGCQLEEDAPLMQAGQKVSLGDGPITRIEGFDHKALKAALQGDWIVTQGDKRVFEFNIVGEQVRVLDHRFAAVRTLRGRLILRSSTSFGVHSVEGPRYFYGFVQTEERTYMGQGGALALQGDERAFSLTLGAWERIEYAEAGCQLISTFGGGVKRQDVKCSFIERAPKEGEEGEAMRTGFRYEAPDPFRPDRLKSVELKLVGNYLMDSELVRSVASRRGDVSPANALEKGDKVSGE